MIRKINKNEGVISLAGLFFTIVTYFLDQKIWAGVIFVVTIFVLIIIYIRNNKDVKNFQETQELAKILFIDDKECQIVTSLKRNDFNVREIDDVLSPATDPNIQWANVIFVDYKDVGKKLFGKKEGLGLVKELKRVYGDTKRYVIYSSVQDFDGLVDFPYIRKNASYNEFISRITTEVTKL